MASSLARNLTEGQFSQETRFFKFKMLSIQ